MLKERPKVNGAALLTEQQVREIKAQLHRRVSAREIALVFGCSTETVRKIGRGDTWNWVTMTPPKADEVLAVEAEASLEKLQRLLKEGKERVEGTNAALDELTLSDSTKERLKGYK